METGKKYYVVSAVGPRSGNKDYIPSYHKPDCPYIRLIRPKNIRTMNPKSSILKKYKECKYCNGLKYMMGEEWHSISERLKSKKMGMCYDVGKDIIYIWSRVGFWKLYIRKRDGEYILMHRNQYCPNMPFKTAKNGKFHRQTEITGNSVQKFVEYVINHDKAKQIIKDDYRKLPTSTKSQRKYFRYAKSKHRRQQIMRVEKIFKTLENSNKE